MSYFQKARKKGSTLLFNGKFLDRDFRMLNPLTNDASFGYISNLKTFPEGHIYLKWGQHIKEHNGFGCSHIWQQHGLEAKFRKYCTSVEDIPALVNRIIVPGTQILDTGKYRPAVVKSPIGTIILDCPNDSRDHYSIVTMYFTSNARGVVIGSIGRAPILENKKER